MIEHGQLPTEPLDLVLHLVQVVKDREAFFEDGPPGQPQPFLRQVADAHAARLLHGAVVQRLKAGQHLHQCRFAGAVGAHEGGLFPRPDEPVGLKE